MTLQDFNAFIGRILKELEWIFRLSHHREKVWNSNTSSYVPVWKIPNCRMNDSSLMGTVNLAIVFKLDMTVFLMLKFCFSADWCFKESILIPKTIIAAVGKFVKKKPLDWVHIRVKIEVVIFYHLSSNSVINTFSQWKVKLSWKLVTLYVWVVNSMCNTVLKT